MGYARAGFEIIGIDQRPMPDYPFEFVQGDALRLVSRYAKGCVAVHASPPCHASSLMTKGTNREISSRYVDLIAATREALWKTHLPTVIENVQGAAVRKDVTLCGEMFGLRVIRHRHFELGRWRVIEPDHIEHKGNANGWRHRQWLQGYYYQVHGTGGSRGTLEEWSAAMGIDWMHSKAVMSQAIPPAYTEWLGHALMRRVSRSPAWA
jgi:hypothetical protein